ncbi:MAG: EAL domain-containing protein [Thalassolituus maritimus]|uniref:EAL domain, c-di-GMP-specific phosphodiesterase class I (Or its enzymatically inactive variant) n=1 Tax=Thalassolituus maritimus TaxID=484498 RepID=A0A1N7PP21_9GAMM|nr:EAL domain-containing protein [Thalassolituus maritimus]TPD54927.1 MAG: EAL domain-containing protein [Thalassolituus maritimus]SIT12099.1 EAL domain, c-di-GMP-specific phosphodiesterase class I (or its enzymatically inactive variant) [Thalassolituus maritimus]
MEKRPDVARQLAEVINEPAPKSPETLKTAISSLIRSVRYRLDMDVGFLSEFSQDQRVFRFVDCASDANLVSEDSCGPLKDSFCEMIADGRLKQLVPDTEVSGETDLVPEFTTIPVKSHVSVPVVLSDGHTFGTFCIFSREVKPKLNNRSLMLVRVFADVIAALIEDARKGSEENRQRQEVILDILERDELLLHAQPITALTDRSIQGFELLARLSTDLDLSPAQLFIDADRLGLSSAIGLRVVEKSKEALVTLPSNAYVSINVTPAFLMQCDISGIYTPEEAKRIVLELTEHEEIADYDLLNARLKPLRDAGMRLAIDDAGAGYASMRHILLLSPDMLKLDMSLIRDIDQDRDKQSLVAALRGFAQVQGYMVVAEGIETEAELAELETLNVCCGQGYLLSRPQPVDTFKS